MLALTGCTGKIGGAVLSAILDYKLLAPSSLVLCTSSDPSAPHWDALKIVGAQVRAFNHEDPAQMTAALTGCTKLFLVSTPNIALDYGTDVPDGKGRERSHIAAIEAARAAGVKHVYYTSLAFGSASRAGVMRAHLRTERVLQDLQDRGQLKMTILREGLYSESWPLYFGFYDALSRDDRHAVVVAGDGPICWTAIADLGVATALVLVEKSDRYIGRTLYLSHAKSTTLTQVARLVSQVRGTEVILEKVARDEYCRYYIARGRDTGHVEWWSSSYDALEARECLIEDPTFTQLLASVGRQPKPLEQTVREMLLHF